MPQQQHRDEQAPVLAAYRTLIIRLDHASPTPRTLEIDILPPASSISHPIHYSAEDHALGVPKDVLIACFLIARSIFFNKTISSVSPGHVSKEPSGNESGDEKVENTEDDTPGNTTNISSAEAASAADIARTHSIGSSDYDKFAATSILLLFDPNHLSALNYRKRHLSHFSHHLQHGPTADLRPLIEQELYFTASLLTSPLRRHNKSSSLFSHRLWLLARFLTTPSTSAPVEFTDLLRQELTLVLTAGEKHAANYYAWNYAREVWESLFGSSHGGVRKDDDGCGVDAVNFAVKEVSDWCLKHPRDISGWEFLIWMLERGSSDSDGRARPRQVLGRVMEWREKLAWQGAALDQFLGRAQGLLSRHEQCFR